MNRAWAAIAGAMAKIAPSDKRRVLQSFTAPSGRVLEYAFDGRCGGDDPVLFHFHPLWMAGFGMPSPYLTYEMYRKPKLPDAGWEAHAGGMHYERRRPRGEHELQTRS